MRLTGNSGFAQLGESLFSDPPEQSNQKRGGPAELKAPRSGVIYRVGLIRHPCLKHPLLENPVLATRKITHATRHSAAQKGVLVPRLSSGMASIK